VTKFGECTCGGRNAGGMIDDVENPARVSRRTSEAGGDAGCHFAIQVQHQDARAPICEDSATGGADAACAAGHSDNLTRKVLSHRHLPFPTGADRPGATSKAGRYLDVRCDPLAGQGISD
jgi:hypothetical protein